MLTPCKCYEVRPMRLPVLQFPDPRLREKALPVKQEEVTPELRQLALDMAERAGCRTVDLTSRPSREAANRLYQRLGFQPRDTNVYRLEF